MSKKYTFLNLAIEVLEQTDFPLTTSMIWEKAGKMGLIQKLDSQGKTPFHTLCALLYSLTKENSHPVIKRFSRRPATFGVRGRKYPILSNVELIDENTPEDECKEEQTGERKDERDIHPLLTKFVRNNNHFRCYTKTIFHEDSIKQRKGLAKWNHPDMVGVYFPFANNEFSEKTLELLGMLKENMCKLFSFEIKRELNSSNYKQYFFQAVSNSSWAHEGYLVTLHLKEDEDLRNDLERLTHAFGIGVIVLNPDNIEQSEMIFPAQLQDRLDVDTVDVLVSTNRDFEEFVDDVITDMGRGNRIRGKYDKEFTSQEMFEHVKKHQLSK